jgi:cellulose synthase/poly-beta-1,6-N-acetylglucosamine synthase-like glycosyltransferase
MTLILVSFACLLAYAVVLLVGHRLFGRLAPYRAVAKTDIGVTVVVAARNEEKNITSCIESLLAQDYNKAVLEILVVDDQSSDQTAEWVRKYQDQGVRLLQTEEPTGTGKKAAIKRGIRAASHEIIVTTDADCTHPTQWINTLVSYKIETGAVMVAAPVKFSKETNWLERFQSLDFLSLQGITAVGVSNKMINMCNGANLLYTKSAFNGVDGFEGIDHIASGDDMLLMEKIAKTYPNQIAYCFSEDATVTTLPATSLGAFIQQRIRWASKAKNYASLATKALLLLVFMVNLLVVVLFVWGLFDSTVLLGFLGCVGIKFLAEWPFMIRAARFFNKTALIKWFLPAQPLHALYTVMAATFGMAGRYQWKGRTVR